MPSLKLAQRGGYLDYKGRMVRADVSLTEAGMIGAVTGH